MISNSKGLPSLTRLPFSIFQPASSSRAAALAKFSRALPEPSVTGGLYSVVNTSGGTWSFSGFKISSSSGEGRPFASISEFWK